MSREETHNVLFQQEFLLIQPAIGYNYAMTLKHYSDIENCPDDKLNLDLLRDGIDEIDAEILSLLEKRLNIVKKVGTYKTLHPSDSKLMIRPGREAKLFRKLIKNEKSDYLPQALVKIWRGIISTALRAEQDMSVIAHTPNGNMDNYWLAQDYFGANLPSSIKSNSQQILDDLRENENLIAFFGHLDAEEKWWKALSKVCDTHNLAVFIRLPLVPNVIVSAHTLIRDPEAYAVGSLVPEESGSDESLWVIQSKSAWPELAKLFATVNENVRLLDRDDDSYLIALQRFCISKDDSSIMSVSHNELVTDLTCIGAYATDIINSEV